MFDLAYLYEALYHSRKTERLTMKLYRFLPVFFASLHLSVVMAAEDQRPPEHICPITHGIMKDPVVAKDGFSYERTAIEQWLTDHNTSPLTRAPIGRELISNRALQGMIRDWQPGNKPHKYELDGQSAESIANLVRAEFDRHKELLSPEFTAKGKHIVAFLGKTGCGKSTLVNLLAGKALNRDGRNYVLANPVDPLAMPIGTGADSRTIYPKSIDVGELRFFDLPGFDDTDGSVRNLINAAFIRKILLDANSVRLVFVAGEDQFTADRGASVKSLFRSLKQLFIMDDSQITVEEMINSGIFIVTKFSLDEDGQNPLENLSEFLLEKTTTQSAENVELNRQIQRWKDKRNLCYVFCPRDGGNNAERQPKEHILSCIGNAGAPKIRGINISVIYPAATGESLKRMFMDVMEKRFNRDTNAPLTTLSEYDQTISYYIAGDFWSQFGVTLCSGDEAVALLKEFAANPYSSALRDLGQSKESRRQAHIQALRDRRQQRVTDVERRTHQKTTEVIAAVSRSSGDLVDFDFARQHDFYDQVCGIDVIAQLATDPLEQDVVRRTYAGDIAQHSHEQMMRWMAKFSGVEALTKRLEEEVRSRDRQNADLKRQLESGMAGLRERLNVVEEFTRIPEVARGHEAVYRRFLQGRLEYRPQENSDVGKIDLPIVTLANPLSGAFDLSRCGDAGQHVYIATGYRKGKIPGNENKLEIWIAPRFLVEKNLHKDAGHYGEIMSGWSCDVGMFWTWGDWENKWYEYLTTDKVMPHQNLYEKWGGRRVSSGNVATDGSTIASYGEKFYMYFS